MRVIVTGGMGFIGSAVVRLLIRSSTHDVLVIDAETYAATRGSLADVAKDDRCTVRRLDITEAPALHEVIRDYAPDAVLHLAAESHVDRSIDGPGVFVGTNVVGTYNLLEAVRSLTAPPRFVHVSTDEVFGSLAIDDEPFNERTPYSPRSPYSATKAAADHLVRAWEHTFGVPTIVTNCSNNYGPYQFPEKLVPLMIIKGISGDELPVYGQGSNVRDWLYVEDHAAGLLQVLESGEPGRTYLFGGSSERTNLQVVETICDLLDEHLGSRAFGSHRSLIRFVADRPGHDLRYAVDAGATRRALGWSPTRTFEAGIADTVRWYLDHRDWWEPILEERYRGGRQGHPGTATP